MKIETVYVLLGSYGQYDDGYIKILSIYTSPLKAEETKRFIESEMQSRKDNPQPEPDYELDEEGWDKWWQLKLETEEFNCCYIQEHLLIP